MFNKMDKERFHELFRNEDNCFQFLYRLKWKGGFKCRRCGHTKRWKGRTRYHSRCVKCDYDESVTANTVFHKIQLPLLKAFTIIYYVTEIKQGVSCRSLSKTLKVGLKAVWLFKRKVQDSMGAYLSAERSASGQSVASPVDGIIILHQKKGPNGLQKIRVSIKKEIGRGKKKKIVRCFVVKDDTEPSEKCSLEYGKYVRENKSILIWNFKSGITGTHHHCSYKYLQGYLDEYCFRLLHRDNERSWEELIRTMISSKFNIYISNGAKRENRSLT